MSLTVTFRLGWRQRPAATMSRTASADEEAKSCAGSSSPSTTRLTLRRTDLRIAVNSPFTSAARAVERRPLPPLVDLDLHDGVNLPDGAARLADLVRVFGVEHEPAADAHAPIFLGDLAEHVRAPVRVIGPHARRDLDDDRAAPVVRGVLHEPDVEVAELRVVAVAVGGFRPLLARPREEAFDGDGDALVAP